MAVWVVPKEENSRHRHVMSTDAAATTKTPMATCTTMESVPSGQPNIQMIESNAATATGVVVAGFVDVEQNYHHADHVHTPDSMTFQETEEKGITTIERKWIQGNAFAVCGHLFGLFLWYLFLMAVVRMNLLPQNRPTIVVLIVVVHTAIGVLELWNMLRLCFNTTVITISNQELVIQEMPFTFCRQKRFTFFANDDPTTKMVKEVRWERHCYLSRFQNHSDAGQEQPRQHNHRHDLQPNMTYEVTLICRATGNKSKVVGHPVLQSEEEAIFLQQQIQRHLNRMNVLDTPSAVVLIVDDKGYENCSVDV